VDDRALFVLVGPQNGEDSEAAKELEKLCKARGVEDLVAIRGQADEKQRRLYHATADCFVHPAKGASSAISIIEAMAARTPVIATKTGIVPEMVEHDKTGLLIEPGRPGEIAEAAIKIIQNRQYCKGLGRAGQKKFRKHFDIERAFVPALWRIYKDMTAAGDVSRQAASGEKKEEKEEKAEKKPKPEKAKKKPQDGQKEVQAPKEDPSSVPHPAERLQEAADQADRRDPNTRTP
jgi:glycogen synthase